jgi:hypothetical protein
MSPATRSACAFAASPSAAFFSLAVRLLGLNQVPQNIDCASPLLEKRYLSAMIKRQNGTKYGSQNMNLCLHTGAAAGFV